MLQHLSAEVQIAERRYAATFNRDDGGHMVFVKGAPEQVLQMRQTAAGEDRLDGERVLAEARRMADEGLRVLAIARQLGIATPGDRALSASELDGCSEAKLQRPVGGR